MSLAEAVCAYHQAEKAKCDAKKALNVARRKHLKDQLDEKKTHFRERYIQDYHTTFSPHQLFELDRQEKELVEQLRLLHIRKTNLSQEQHEKWKLIEKHYEEEATRNRWRIEFLKHREAWR